MFSKFGVLLKSINIKCILFTFILAIFWPTSLHAKNTISLEKTCQLSPAKCLIQIEDKLLTTPKRSRLWFSLMQYKIENLFVLQKTEELYQQTAYWVKQDNLPVSFQLTVYIYYAKSILGQGKTDEGTKYIHKAKQQLLMINEVYPAPIRLIEIANLQMFIGELNEAYLTLQELSVTYKKSRNAHFMMELYGHLAHIARQLNYFDEELTYWQVALTWGYELGNTQQIAVILYNKARAQHIAKMLDKAATTYQQSIITAEQAQDFVKASHARLYFAELRADQTKKEEALVLLLAINQQHINNKQMKLYTRLIVQLKAPIDTTTP
jgi:hypothetical protein